MIHTRWITVLLLGRAAQAQSGGIVVRDAGPGPVGHVLAATLAKPDTRVIIADSVQLARDSVYPASVVVFARRVITTSTVKGDLIVVGGDLFMHPGAMIAGQAIAIGGGIYNSSLSRATAGQSSNRDFTFDTLRVNGVLELTYRELSAPAPRPVIPLPFSFGWRLPSYDRSSGLSLSLGPTRSFMNDAANVTALATYRSQIGTFDPSLDAEWQLRRKFRVAGFVGRDSRSNEAWITSDVSNSVNAFFIGRDTRNWYRADAGDLTAYQTFETPTMIANVRFGGHVERASAARPDSAPMSGPWSFVDRESREGMLRPNPQVSTKRISSIVAGSNFAWTLTDVKAALDLAAEIPVAIQGGGRFVQTTVDGQVFFPTFGTQSYRFDVHAIVTSGETAPMQRWAYLGGAGTLGTVEPLLSIGGDQLLFLESRYIVPVPSVSLPIVGSPTVTFRHILGSAGVQHLPALTQILGLRVSVMLLRADLLFDTQTHKSEFHAGLALVR